jgi:glycosyltransferase involved in cell wall biosynthesis
METDKPYFSIILPTFNRLYSIKSVFLPSLESQEYSNYELIIVDDGSSDGTEKFFQGEEFILAYPKIQNRTKFVKNASNKGLPTSRNIGFENSRGKWIFMVEDDLILERDFLKKAENLIKRYADTFKIISPMRVESTRGYYTDCFDGFIKIGKFSGEIYVNPNYKNIQANIPSTHACSIIHNSILKTYKYAENQGLAFREESDFYFNITSSSSEKIIYLGELLKTTHKNNISLEGGTRQNNKSLFFKELSYIKDTHISKNIF